MHLSVSTTVAPFIFAILYNYELLNQGHYDLIDDNVSEQIALFDISKEPVKVFFPGEIEELMEMGLFSGLGTDPIEKINRQVESSEKVLKYIRV